MVCPRCQSNLRQIIYEGINIDTCDKCEGEWLDKNEILLINAAREVVFSAEEKAKISGAKEAVVGEVKQPEKPLICPRCNTSLQELNYAYSTGIIVDRCTKCDGLWLDNGELEAIQIVIEEWEKKIPELKAQYRPVLTQIEKEYAKKSKKIVDEVMDKRSKLLKSPTLDPLIKSVMYKFF